MNHLCQYVVRAKATMGAGYVSVESVTYCSDPAPIKYDGEWLCAEHYDKVAPAEQTVYNQDK